MFDFQKWSKQGIGYLEGWISIVINCALFAGKLWVGLLFNSIAMIADAWHSLSDSLTSLVIIIGFWISGKPADQEHPFGHGRAETIASIIIGTLLAVVGGSFLVESIIRLANYQVAQFQTIAIIIFMVSVLTKEGLAQFSFSLGKLINSSSLKADGWHHRTDAIASLLIVVGALFSGLFWWIDGVLGILVSSLILFAAFQIIIENTNVMLGQGLAPKLGEEIKAMVLAFSAKISDIHHFHYHKYGDHAELTFHIRVFPDMHVKKAHEFACEIEKKIKAQYGFETTIHIEPKDSSVNNGKKSAKRKPR